MADKSNVNDDDDINNKTQKNDESKSNVEPLTLRISGLGHNLTIQVDPNCTVGSLKEQIESQTSLPASYQRLLARGKKLENDSVTLGHDGVGVEHRTRIVLLHNEAYALDKAGIEKITALRNEIDELNSRVATADKSVIHERITQVCCELDGVDVHGSDRLRALRKKTIELAEEVGRKADECNSRE